MHVFIASNTFITLIYRKTIIMINIFIVAMLLRGLPVEE